MSLCLKRLSSETEILEQEDMVPEVKEAAGR